MKQRIIDIPRIEIDLLRLKSREDLEAVYRFYKKSLDKFFTREGLSRAKFFKEVTCPICRSRASTLKVRVDGFDYVECRKCKAVYNNPQLNDKYIAKMYAEGEYKTYFQKMVVKSQKIRKGVIEKRKYEQINSFFRKPGKILDVGCGSGSFLKIFQEHGWQILGIEPSLSASQFAKKEYGIDVIRVPFEKFYAQEKFDCVTFWGLEHLANPMAGMKKAVGLLSANGLIVFESPSADGFLMKYLVKNQFSPYRYIESARHVLFFSKQSIDFMCRKFNLELAYLESSGLDIQTILPYEFNEEIRRKLRGIQQILDEQGLGDHYRVFLRKRNHGC